MYDPKTPPSKEDEGKPLPSWPKEHAQWDLPTEPPKETQET